MSAGSNYQLHSLISIGIETFGLLKPYAATGLLSKVTENYLVWSVHRRRTITVHACVCLTCATRTLYHVSVQIECIDILAKPVWFMWRLGVLWHRVSTISLASNNCMAITSTNMHICRVWLLCEKSMLCKWSKAVAIELNIGRLAVVIVLC